MEKYFIRSEDLEQKIHSVKLPYLAWKVLFLLGEKQNISSLSELLGEESSSLEQAIEILQKEGLVSPLPEKEEAAMPEESLTETTAPETSETTVEQATEEEPTLAPLEEEPEQKVEQETAIKAEELQEAETLPEEEPTTEAEGIEESAPEETEEIKDIEDFDLPEIKEESALKEESSEVEEETLFPKEEESQIELPSLEEESEKLEVDLETTEESKVEEAAPKKEKKAQVGAQTILVIDDSIVIRKMVELALEGEDLVLETASSGKEAMQKLDDIKPDLVILDLMLPDINGIDLLKTIKASLGIPVIMLSGKDSPQMVEKAKAEGANAFLPKPFRDEDLVKTIHELLEK